MVKRERLGIIFDILNIIKENKNSIRATPLLRYSNLSSQRFFEYLSELLEKNFIIEIENKSGVKYYSLSDKGLRFLENYQAITGFIEEFDL